MSLLPQIDPTRLTRVLSCIVAVPVFVLAGLLLNGAIVLDAGLTTTLAAWQVIFVLSIVLPAHVVAFALVGLLANQRFAFRHPRALMLASCALGALAIVLLGARSPFAVFSLAVSPWFLLAYVFAVGREHDGREEAAKPDRQIDPA